MHIKRPLRLGHSAQRDARLVTVTAKQGRSGEFLLITVEYEYFQDEKLCITEQQDLVYRHGSSPSSAGDRPVGVNSHRVHRTVIPTKELLFRYSAVTFNTHRIHYDRDYAVHAEGHPDLVVQGPLLATWLAGLAAELLRRTPRTFSFRGTSPTFVDQPVRLVVVEAGEGQVELSALAPTGVGAMIATAT